MFLNMGTSQENKVLLWNYCKSTGSVRLKEGNFFNSTGTAKHV